MEDRKFICPCYRHEQDISETGHCICHLFVSDDYVPLQIGEPPTRDEGSPWPEIVVYAAYWCSDSLRTRQFLNRHAVPYLVRDVDQDPEAAGRVMKWTGGHLSTPTLEIAGRIVFEPTDEELAAILGIA